MSYFTKVEAKSIRLHYDGVPLSQIPLQCDIEEKDARRAVRRYWAYEKRLFGKPDFQDIRREVFGGKCAANHGEFSG